jgi:hypothetical protein
MTQSNHVVHLTGQRKGSTKTNGRVAVPTRWENEGYMKTVELLLKLIELIHQMRKVVMGDSGLCVTQSMVALDKKGVYGQFLIKTRRCWPKYVPRELIDSHKARKHLQFHWRVFGGPNSGPINSSCSSCPWQR